MKQIRGSTLIIVKKAMGVSGYSPAKDINYRESGQRTSMICFKRNGVMMCHGFPPCCYVRQIILQKLVMTTAEVTN
jgi:hypothetical protein